MEVLAFEESTNFKLLEDKGHLYISDMGRFYLIINPEYKISFCISLDPYDEVHKI